MNSEPVRLCRIEFSVMMNSLSRPEAPDLDLQKGVDRFRDHCSGTDGRTRTRILHCVARKMAKHGGIP